MQTQNKQKMQGWRSIGLDKVTKQPQLSCAEEIEVVVQDGVSVLSESKAALYMGGVVRVTTHQLIWVDSSYEGAHAIGHDCVKEVEEHNSGMIGSRRAQLRVWLKEGAGPSFRLEFWNTADRDKIRQHYNDCLRRKLWEVKKKEAPQFSSQYAGIGGIMRKVEHQAAEDSKSLQEAFSDLDSLIKSADDLVKIANKLKVQQEKLAARDAPADDKGTKESNEVADLLLNMGIVTAITKQSAGSLFHEELARSICGWLLGPMGAKVCIGGMVTLPDVYCAYNRARGSDLISPEDLLRAAMLMEKLGLPMRLRDFSSGVRVLESIARSEERSTKALVTLVEHADATKGVDAVGIADRLGIAVSLALEELLVAEDGGLICRDESLQGLFFFPNRWAASRSAK